MESLGEKVVSGGEIEDILEPKIDEILMKNQYFLNSAHMQCDRAGSIQLHVEAPWSILKLSKKTLRKSM